MDKKIAIITATGGSLGTGHFQRMLFFAQYANEKKRLKAQIYSKTMAPLDGLEYLWSDSLKEANLIIRDMRDSNTEEIKILKKHAPVLSIDDMGEGNAISDYSLYLLPNLSLNHIDFDKFLYGYNFYNGLKEISEENIYKDIDFLIYPGISPDSKTLEILQKILPEGSKSLVLIKGKAYNLHSKELSKINNYSELILRAKNVITHFGITLFEAKISQCNIISFNPSDYHQRLTELIARDFNIELSCQYSEINSNHTQEELHRIYKNSQKKDNYIAKSPILIKIETKVKNFTRYIENLL
ncbi:MAG TPA: hypothetical protein P5566_09985 [Spirochaetota bacterium]|nr:hypothetical protein [Spirochaetota bacterium]